MMAAGVVLDTSFLITLADSARPHHEVAVRYWKKILAHAIVKDAAWVITDDAKTFVPFATRLVQDGRAAFRPIGLGDGFDAAHFNGGQRDLPFPDGLEDRESDA